MIYNYIFATLNKILPENTSVSLSPAARQLGSAGLRNVQFVAKTAEMKLLML